MNHFSVPEQYRLRSGIKEYDTNLGNNGAFQIPHPYIAGYFFLCIASDQKIEEDQVAWEHVSVSLYKVDRKTCRRETVERCPTWERIF